MEVTERARARVAVDAMGADRSPRVEVEGALAALAEADIEVVLVGDEARLRQTLTEVGGAASAARLRIQHAPEVIGMDESPAIAIKHKKASSLRVCFDLAKAGEVDAVVSAGNSGAVMAGALFVLGRIAGVERPAIVTTFPTRAGRCVLLDMGANVEPRATVLVQQAVMGATYARLTHDKPMPRVGLLSNGAEEHKGTALTREAHRLLLTAAHAGAPLGFEYLGYVEGGDVFRGKADVVVTDGFTGNVLLKGCEGLVDWLLQAVIEEVRRGRALEKLGALLMKPALRRLRRRTDYAETGAAPLVGANGVVLICHGASDAKAIKNGVLTASRYSDLDLRQGLTRGIAEHAHLWHESVVAKTSDDEDRS